MLLPPQRSLQWCDTCTLSRSRSTNSERSCLRLVQLLTKLPGLHHNIFSGNIPRQKYAFGLIFIQITPRPVPQPSIIQLLNEIRCKELRCSPARYEYQENGRGDAAFTTPKEPTQFCGSDATGRFGKCARFRCRTLSCLIVYLFTFPAVSAVFERKRADYFLVCLMSQKPNQLWNSCLLGASVSQLTKRLIGQANNMISRLVDQSRINWFIWTLVAV